MRNPYHCLNPEQSNMLNMEKYDVAGKSNCFLVHFNPFFHPLFKRTEYTVLDQMCICMGVYLHFSLLTWSFLCCCLNTIYAYPRTTEK